MNAEAQIESSCSERNASKTHSTKALPANPKVWPVQLRSGQSFSLLPQAIGAISHTPSSRFMFFVGASVRLVYLTSVG